MSQDQAILYLWNILINSTLTFFTLLLFFAPVSRLFAFTSRVKVMWGLLLFIHLGLHPFHYTWENWAQNNPWQAKMQTRQLTLVCGYVESDFLGGLFTWIPRTSLSMHHLDGSTFTPADAICYLLPFAVIQIFVVIALSGSFFFLARLGFTLLRQRAFYQQLMATSTPFQEKIQSDLLLHALKRSRIRLRVSSTVNAPCAYGIVQQVIFIPEALLSKLTQEELEAILMHECGHLRYRDALISLVCQVIHNLFWWIPTGPLLRQIFVWQEEACDDEVERFKSDPCDLASALCQTARSLYKADQNILFSSLAGKSMQPSQLQHRIQRLLEKSAYPASLGLWSALRFISASAFLLTVILGRFWVF